MTCRLTQALQANRENRRTPETWRRNCSPRGPWRVLPLADMDLNEDTVEDYIRNIIVHIGEPGTPGD